MSNTCFAVNGSKGATVYLVVDHPYLFTFDQTNPNPVNGTFEHLFFFTTDPVGGPAGLNTDPADFAPPVVPGTPPPFGTFSTVCITPTKRFPKIFYYQCANHQFEGGLVILTDCHGVDLAHCHAVHPEFHRLSTFFV